MLNLTSWQSLTLGVCVMLLGCGESDPDARLEVFDGITLCAEINEVTIVTDDPSTAEPGRYGRGLTVQLPEIDDGEYDFLGFHPTESRLHFFNNHLWRVSVGYPPTEASAAELWQAVVEDQSHRGPPTIVKDSVPGMPFDGWTATWTQGQLTTEVSRVGPFVSVRHSCSELAEQVSAELDEVVSVALRERKRDPIHSSNPNNAVVTAEAPDEIEADNGEN